MNSGHSARVPRMEARAPAKSAIRIASLESPETSELLTVEDVSRHGARAIAATPWVQGKRVLVRSVNGTFRARGRVVYCEPDETTHGRFAVGLEFFWPTGKWED